MWHDVLSKRNLRRPRITNLWAGTKKIERRTNMLCCATPYLLGCDYLLFLSCWQPCLALLICYVAALHCIWQHFFIYTTNFSTVCCIKATSQPASLKIWLIAIMQRNAGGFKWVHCNVNFCHSHSWEYFPVSAFCSGDSRVQVNRSGCAFKNVCYFLFCLFFLLSLLHKCSKGICSWSAFTSYHMVHKGTFPCGYRELGKHSVKLRELSQLQGTTNEV